MKPPGALALAALLLFLLGVFYTDASATTSLNAGLGKERLRMQLLSAVDYINSGQFEDATSVVKGVLELDPRNSDALHLLAVVLLKSGSSDLEQIASLSQAAIPFASSKGGGQTAQYYNTLGLALMDKGEVENAIRAFDTSLEVSSGAYTAALYNKGACLMNAKQYARAAAHWKLMLQKYPSDAKAKIELAASLREAPMRDYRQSQAILQKLVQENPGDAKAAFQLGVTVHVGGRPSEAVWHYNRVLELETAPESALRRSAQLNMAAVLQERGEFAKALQTLEKLIEGKKQELSRSDSGAFNNAGACYWQMENTAKAFEMYSKALELNPESTEALINMGVYYYELGDLLESERSYDKAIQIEQERLRGGQIPTRAVTSGLKIRKALLMRPIMTSMESIAEVRETFARNIDKLFNDQDLVIQSPVRDIERTHFYLMCEFSFFEFQISHFKIVLSKIYVVRLVCVGLVLRQL